MSPEVDVKCLKDPRAAGAAAVRAVLAESRPPAMFIVKLVVIYDHPHGGFAFDICFERNNQLRTGMADDVEQLPALIRAELVNPEPKWLPRSPQGC